MQTTCSRNHIYDSDIYATCPYCNRGTQAIHFGATGAVKTVMPGAGGYQPTVAPGGSGGYQPTVAPGGAGGGYQDNDIGRTEVPGYIRERQEKEKKDRTVGIFKKKTGLDPVVGWLVCIEGPEKGQDYRLLNRINTIGRAEGNDVVLASEQTVSQRNHARLAYDEKHNNFQIIPGEGHNITYVNDVPLYVPQQLHAYDVLELGETKLIFIPLCTEHFKWSQEAK